MFSFFRKKAVAPPQAEQPEDLQEMIAILEAWHIRSDLYHFAMPKNNPAALAAYKKLQGWVAANGREVLLLAAEKEKTVRESKQGKPWYNLPHPYVLKFNFYRDLVDYCLSKKPALQQADFPLLMEIFTDHEFPRLKSFNRLTEELEKQVEKMPLTEDFKAFLEQKLQHPYFTVHANKPVVRLKNRLENILAYQPPHPGEAAAIWLDESDDFGKRFNQFLREQPHPQQQAWFRFIGLCNQHSGMKPPAKFFQRGDEIFSTISQPVERLTGWVEQLLGAEISTTWRVANKGRKDGGKLLWKRDVNEPFIKGMIWMASRFANVALADVLAQLALRCLKTQVGIKTAAPVIGLACTYSLAQMEGLTGIRMLFDLKENRLKKQYKEKITSNLMAAAKAKGLTIHDLQDLVLNDFGNQTSWRFGEYEAKMDINLQGEVNLTWMAATGKPLKKEPASVKKQHAAGLAQIRQQLFSLRKMLGGQCKRFDRIYLENRSWQMWRFEEQVLRHLVLGNLAQRMIWHFEKENRQANAMLLNEKWQTPDGQTLDWLTSETKVTPWHPANSPADEVLAWRKLIESQGIVQPFPQAHRQIYLLTEAELTTRIYSNRMAAHIVDYDIFRDETKKAGWNYFELNIPAFKLNTRLWIDYLHNAAPAQPGWSGRMIATDQVRFTPQNGWEPTPLLDVPGLVFSEVMRDLDLCLAAASVGIDPNWQDRGNGHGRNAWRSYSFGDLSEAAGKRKEVLEQLLPKLKIAPVAKINDNFLVVRGKRRTYKLHIGSTNILMEPNDQYLCIVESHHLKKGGNPELWLPFAGDHGLAVLLSKAFLLADDDKITDPTILSQLKR